MSEHTPGPWIIDDGGAEGPDGIDWDEITPEQAWNMYLRKYESEAANNNKDRINFGMKPIFVNRAISPLMDEVMDLEFMNSLLEGTQLTDAEVLAAYKRMQDAADKYRLDAGRQMIADREI